MSSTLPRNNAHAPVVALTGFMAAGKSTIGRVLASLLHWPFIDLDCEIETRSGRRIREIFLQDGEARFRQIESEALRDVLATAKTPTVIALGGGTSVQSGNFELLRGTHLVFIELDIEILLQRCRALNERPEQNPRPLAADEDALRSLYVLRLPQYREAELTVNGHDKNADQMAHEIAEALGLLPVNRRR